jgi:1-deoxy-D-xylulose-5-phosphate synthase
VFERGLPVLVIEDNTIVGGFGSAILEFASSNGYPLNNVRRLGVPDKFVEHDSPDVLHEMLGMTADKIAVSARKLLKIKSTI